MKISLLVILLIFTSNFTFANSTYSDQEHRKLKAFSDNETNGYLNGKGMGFAKPAELNSYPGPRHVLDLSKKLNLSISQINETEALFNNMQKKAKEFGKILIDKEIEIENLFLNNIATPEVLDTLLIEAANIKAKIRFAHLVAHIQQKSLLSNHQIQEYNKIRGYTGDKNTQHNHHH